MRYKVNVENGKVVCIARENENMTYELWVAAHKKWFKEGTGEEIACRAFWGLEDGFEAIPEKEALRLIEEA